MCSISPYMDHLQIVEKKADKCPYCSGKLIIRDADEIYTDKGSNEKLFVCSNYPKCDTYTRATLFNGKLTPVAIPGNKQLRNLRAEAHYYFDKISELGILSRTDSYKWLSERLELKYVHSHIGEFSEYQCIQTIEEAVKILQVNKDKSSSKLKPYLRRNSVTYTMKNKELLRKLEDITGQVINIEYPARAFS